MRSFVKVSGSVREIGKVQALFVSESELGDLERIDDRPVGKIESVRRKEGRIEIGIMGQYRIVSKKCRHFFPDVSKSGGVGDVGIGNAGNVLDFFGNGNPGIDEARKLFDRPVFIKADHRDLDNGIGFRIEPGGFEIESDDGRHSEKIGMGMELEARRRPRS